MLWIIEIIYHSKETVIARILPTQDTPRGSNLHKQWSPTFLETALFSVGFRRIFAKIWTMISPNKLASNIITYLAQNAVHTNPKRLNIQAKAKYTSAQCMTRLDMSALSFSALSSSRKNNSFAMSEWNLSEGPYSIPEVLHKPLSSSFCSIHT